MSGALTDALLPDVATTHQNLYAWADAITKVTQCARQSLDTTVPPIDDRDEAVARLGRSLLDVQAEGRYWIDHLRPALVQSVPQDIQAYAQIFEQNARQILALLNTFLGPDAMAELARLVRALQSDLAMRVQQTSGLYSQMKALLSRFQDCFRTVKGAKDAAVWAVQLDEGKLEALANEYRAICAERSLSDDLMGFLLAPLDQSPLMMVSVSLNPAFLAVNALARLGAKLVSLFEGGDLDDAMRQRINRLESLRRTMNDEQRRVAAMRLMLEEVERLVASADDAARASEQIFRFWKALEAKQAAVLAAVAKGDGQSIAAVGRMHVETARQAWSQLAHYARDLKVV